MIATSSNKRDVSKQKRTGITRGEATKYLEGPLREQRPPSTRNPIYFPFYGKPLRVHLRTTPLSDPVQPSTHHSLLLYIQQNTE